MSAFAEMIRTQESTPLTQIIVMVAANGDSDFAERAASELAQLRAQAAELAAARTALEQAREFAEFVADQLRYDKDHYLFILADAWLAAHAPQAEVDDLTKRMVDAELKLEPWADRPSENFKVS